MCGSASARSRTTRHYYCAGRHERHSSHHGQLSIGLSVIERVKPYAPIARARALAVSSGAGRGVAGSGGPRRAPGRRSSGTSAWSGARGRPSTAGSAQARSPRSPSDARGPARRTASGPTSPTIRPASTARTPSRDGRAPPIRSAGGSRTTPARCPSWSTPTSRRSVPYCRSGSRCAPHGQIWARRSARNSPARPTTTAAGPRPIPGELDLPTLLSRVDLGQLLVRAPRPGDPR